MSNDKSREQFEDWAVTTGFEPHHFAVRGDGEYQVYDVRRLWGPWQASRAAIEVELADLRARLAERDALLKDAKTLISIYRDNLEDDAAELEDIAIAEQVLREISELSAAKCSEVDPQCSEVLRTQGEPVERKRHVARTDAVYDESWVGEKLPAPKCTEALRPMAVAQDGKPCDKHAWQCYPGRNLDYCIFCLEKRDHVEGFEGMTDAEADLMFRGLAQ